MPDTSHPLLNFVSSAFGAISISIWMCATLPQLLQNYKAKSTKGISIHFLGLWFLGDALNFTGCLLTGQLLFQTLLAGFFVFSDSMLLLQRHYYLRRARAPAYQLPPQATPFKISATILSSTASALGSPLWSRELPVASESHTIGRIIAWSCTAIYILSRIPQLRKNYQRKSTEGVSPLLFCCTLAGNLTYTLSILTSTELLFLESSRPLFLQRELPYILGSMGTVVFDLGFFWQWRMYAKAPLVAYEMHNVETDREESAAFAD
ncbi:hypothetical protein BABINDRAFT_160446 [Babjeviella inositovora NRRL Y-12698]|uniref:Uncharacterized protein n=1 Tax=Babjeviella inositovora NRRL Y-12698 TaxID=984486 RepID=A0A1E3QTM2_9ASCO|nr:uncharacterized protein BABINDRAFT_160446 [Babjeviella inositovora NRRL Y-12698]ODQ81026.1 hypothetical protein BABINDRAFT_160446 [Babjeviella inositovora NRRL Y-12698]